MYAGERSWDTPAFRPDSNADRADQFQLFLAVVLEFTAKDRNPAQEDCEGTADDSYEE